MKKLVFVGLFICFYFSGISQDRLPSYPQILNHFFSKYKGSQINENYTSFAKKKDGWYVQQVNRYSGDSLLNETLFWSLSKNAFISLPSYSETDTSQDIENAVQPYLSDASLLYGFERCSYFGYNGWNIDVINEFKEVEVLNDTLLESLARAYAFTSDQYFWHQYGGLDSNKDPLKIKLKRTEIPSEERIKQAKFNLVKSIETLVRLEKQNPNYRTLIGSIHLKIFNETIHGYSLMVMAQSINQARYFFDNAFLAKPYVNQAKNYLNSCDKNAIIFTYGDNDTYQLWYVQEKENFRKDVLVINTNLLGLPIYVDMLKKGKKVKLTIPSSFYKSNGSDISYFKENTKVKCGKNVLYDGFEKSIFSHQFPEVNAFPSPNRDTVSTYPCQHYLIPINFHSNFLSKGVTNKQFQEIEVNLNTYIYFNELAMINIINGNINSRPIYFSSKPNMPFSNTTLQQGLLDKLVNPDLLKNNSIKDFVEAQLENFIERTYVPVLSNTNTMIYDGDNCFAQLYATVVEYHIARADFVSAKSWTKKALSKINNFENHTIYTIGALARMSLIARNYKEAKELYTFYFKKMVANYFEPNAMDTYKSKSECLEELNGIKQLFEEEDISVEEMDLLIKQLGN